MDRVDDAMHSNSGRIARVAIGGGLLGLGIGKGGRMGALMSLIGLEPLLAGLFNFSLLDILSGGSTRGGYTDDSEFERPSSSDIESRVGMGSRTGTQSHTEQNVGVESGNTETSIGP
jgi:hypothetical protein